MSFIEQKLSVDVRRVMQRLYKNAGIRKINRKSTRFGINYSENADALYSLRCVPDANIANDT